VELLLRLKSTPCIVMLMTRQSDLSLEISLPQCWFITTNRESLD